MRRSTSDPPPFARVSNVGEAYPCTTACGSRQPGRGRFLSGHIGPAAPRGEPGAFGEVDGMAAQIGEVLLQRHATAWWPVVIWVAGSRADVLDARRPGSVIRFVVPRPQRFEPKSVGDQGCRRIEADWDERI